ncbi:hypothetical protein MIMGU_mgv1a021948mg, partial [Erythranthe guttata]
MADLGTIRRKKEGVWQGPESKPEPGSNPFSSSIGSHSPSTISSSAGSAAIDGSSITTASTSVRQIGQVVPEMNHLSTHSKWKKWPHLGRRRRHSFSLNSDKQTAHSRLSWCSGAAFEGYRNVGTESTTA